MLKENIIVGRQFAKRVTNGVERMQTRSLPLIGSLCFFLEIGSLT